MNLSSQKHPQRLVLAVFSIFDNIDRYYVRRRHFRPKINDRERTESDAGSSSARVDETVGTAFLITNSNSFSECRIVVVNSYTKQFQRSKADKA